MKTCPLILIAGRSSGEAQALLELLDSDCRIKMAHNGADALAIARHHPLPDLVMLDMELSDMAGLEVCRLLKQSAMTRNIPVIFVTAVHDASQEALALNLQAADYITKPYSLQVAKARVRNRLLSHTTQSVRAIRRHIPVQLPRNNGLPDEHPGAFSDLTQGARSASNDNMQPMALSHRQTEILSLIAEGLTSAEIGVQLSIAKGTAEVHRENIMRKLDVHNIAGLVKYAIRHGLAQA